MVLDMLFDILEWDQSRCLNFGLFSVVGSLRGILASKSGRQRAEVSLRFDVFNVLIDFFVLNLFS